MPMTRDQLVNELAYEIDPGSGPGTEAKSLARELVDLVHDRGVGDIGDLRAALKRLAVHFPRTRAEGAAVKDFGVDLSVISGITTVGQLRFAKPNGKEAEAVMAVLRRCSLGPAFPLRGPVLVSVGSRDELPGSRMSIATYVPERTTGEQTDVVFNNNLPPLSVCGEQALLRIFLRMLEGMAIHEVKESLRFEGQLVDDPHAGERERFPFHMTVKA